MIFITTRFDLFQLIKKYNMSAVVDPRQTTRNLLNKILLLETEKKECREQLHRHVGSHGEDAIDKVLDELSKAICYSPSSGPRQRASIPNLRRPTYRYEYADMLFAKWIQSMYQKKEINFLSKLHKERFEMILADPTKLGLSKHFVWSYNANVASVLKMLDGYATLDDIAEYRRNVLERAMANTYEVPMASEPSLDVVAPSSIPTATSLEEDELYSYTKLCEILKSAYKRAHRLMKTYRVYFDRLYALEENMTTMEVYHPKSFVPQLYDHISYERWYILSLPGATWLPGLGYGYDY